MLKAIKDYIYQMIKLHSLRSRIFVIVLLVGIVPSILMRYAIVENYEERAVRLRQESMQDLLSTIASHLVTNNYLENYLLTDQQTLANKNVINAELEMLSGMYDGRILIINSNFNIIRDTYGLSEGKTVISEEVIKCFQGERLFNYDDQNGFIELTTPIVYTVPREDGESDSVVRGVMLTSISSDSITETMRILYQQSLTIEMLVIVFIVSLAFVLSYALTRPFNKVTAAIKEVKEGYSDEAISVPDYVETVQIIDAFNELLREKRAMDDSRQEFVANVSHELKTPMTSMKVLADSLLTQPDAPVEFYREFMEDIVSEIDRENQIITDLLSLVKMDKKVQDMNISSVSINDLTELILKRLRPIARKKDVEITFESNRNVVAEVDEVKMSLIISNLVENAIKYNNDHGWVKVVLDADHQYFTLAVGDSGIGIPEESLAQIYERFYRVDKSHSREIGGTGLGLAITKNAVLMHRGSITVTSTLGIGTTFQVKIPITYNPPKTPESKETDKSRNGRGKFMRKA